jgi:hypothetical protein
MNLKLIISIIITTIGIAGFIFFFPIQTNQHYCCPAHKILKTNMPLHEHHTVTDDVNYHSAFLDFYLRHYSFFWWGSTLLAVGAGYILYKQLNNRYKQNKRSSYVVR